MFVHIWYTTGWFIIRDWNVLLVPYWLITPQDPIDSISNWMTELQSGFCQGFTGESPADGFFHTNPEHVLVWTGLVQGLEGCQNDHITWGDWTRKFPSLTANTPFTYHHHHHVFLPQFPFWFHTYWATLLGSNDPNTTPDPTWIWYSRSRIVFYVSARTPLCFGLRYNLCSLWTPYFPVMSLVTS